MPRATSLAPSPFSRWMISCSYHVVLVLFVNLLSVAAHGLLPGYREEHHDTQIYIRKPDLIMSVGVKTQWTIPAMFLFSSVSKRVFCASVLF